MKFFSELKNYKSNIALVIDDENSITYYKLLDEARKLSKKIKKKSLVFILANNDLETISSLIAMDINESVSMLLDSKINDVAFKKLNAAYSPDYIFLEKNINLNIDNFENIFQFYNYYLLINKNKTQKKLNENLFLLQTTSGSTGSPKNVRLSYENLNENVYSITKNLKIEEKDITITTLPPSYVYGLSIINSHLKTGAKIILNKSSVIEKFFWKRLVLHKVNNFGGVPYIYEIISKVGLKSENYKFIKYSTVAGGHMSNRLKEKFLDFYDPLGISLVTMYGAAEATSRMSSLLPKFSRTKLGSIGTPIENGEFYLQDENNNKIEKSMLKGELIYKGKNVFMGYAFNQNDLIKGDESKSILKTGDIAFKDDDGFYFLIGKKSRYVKLVGNRISLEEIEKIIYEYGYKNVCSQNVKDKLCIHVNEKNVEKKIKSFVSKYTSLHESLFKINYLESFPMTKNHKIDYNHKIFKNEN